MKNKFIVIAFLLIAACFTAVAQNSWAIKNNFDGGARNGAVSFSIGNNGYLGTGGPGTNGSIDFWKYDPILNVWTQKANVGGPVRHAAVGFSVGANGYIGLGFDGSATNYNDLWQYDTTANVWNPRANFPGTARYAAVSFSIGTKGYVGTGQGGGYLGDFWEFNTLTNSWLQKTNFPGTARFLAAGFSIGTKGYIGTGQDGTDKTDFYEWNQATDTWTQKANFIGAPRFGATGLSFGGKGFIGTGLNASSVNYDDFYEYDPGTNSWILRANIPGTTRHYATGFSIANKGYIATGVNAADYDELFEYTPIFSTSISSHTDNICIGGNSGSATASTFFGQAPYTYSWAPSGGTGITASNLTSGTYTVTVTDANTFSATATVTIAPPTSPNSWVQKANAGSNGRTYAVGFSIGTKGYIGTGNNGGGNFQDFWEYNPDTDVWTQKANFSGSARQDAVGFNIGTKGYLGLGWDGASVFQDFWEYDPASNTWVAKANFPGLGRSGATSFSIATKGYIGTGYNGGRLQDFWEFDPFGNSWTPKPSFPGTARYLAAGFSIGTKGYIGMGNDGNANPSDFYEWNPATNVWTQKANFIGGSWGRAACFSIGNLGFVATGQSSQNLYQWNQANETWTTKANFLGVARNGAVGFAINNKGYVGTGTDNGSSSFYLDFYEYTPILQASISSIINVNCTGGNDGTATGVASAGTPPYTYSWAPSGGTNATATNLIAGNYTLTVTDACGQVATATVAITQPLPNSWVQKANFLGIARSGAVGFSIGTKGYLGTGYDGTVYYKDFWEWDQATNVWTQKADFGGVARSYAVGFSMGSNGYIGTGFSGVYNNDFWEWDQFTNIWTQKANFLGTARSFATGFAIGNKGYIGTGSDAGGYTQDFWQWDKSTNLWAMQATFGGGIRESAVGFSIGTKGYIGTGFNGTNQSDFWEWDQVGNAWVQKTSFGGSARRGAAAFSIGNKGYVGSGLDNGGDTQDFWEWNQASNSWTVRANVLGATRRGAVGFSIGNKGYIGTGYAGAAPYTDFYEYYPLILAPNSAFTSTPSGQTINFSNTSTNANSYLWNFGDGTTSTQTNPVHTYNLGGTYNVCLISYGFCTNDTTCANVIINCASPIASFNKSVSNLTVNFTSTSTNAASYLWNFGDGNTSTLQNPSHVYVNTGSFNVCLIVTNGCGTSQTCQLVNTTCVAPSASYNFSITGMSVVFTNTSPNAAVSAWDFDDIPSGANNTSSLFSPSHTFSSPGLKNVRLIVSNGCDADTVTQALTINCAIPQPNIQLVGNNGLQIQYVGTASVGAFSYNWNFGNGATSILPFGNYTYPLSGTYTVSLITTNSCGSDSTSQVISVCVNPASNFTYTATGQTVSFNYTGSQATNYLWNFGDAYGSNVASPTHTYDTSGVMNVCLIVENNCQKDTLCQNIQINCSPTMNPQICMVRVDSLSLHNVIYWDKTIYQKIDTFLVYREITSNNYQIIGRVSKDSMSLFIDTVATKYFPNTGDPNFTSYRYKLGLVDSCGNLSLLSPFHQTIKMNDQLNGNFDWNHYEIEGQAVPILGLVSYELMRDNNLDGIFETSLGTTTTLGATDGFYFTFQNTADWRVFTNWNISCNPTLRVNEQSNSQLVITKSRSNIKNNRISGINLFEDNNGIIVYPNPALNELTISLRNDCHNCSVQIVNTLGQTLMSDKLSSLENKINISNLENGIYYVKITNENKQLFLQKVIVQK